MSQPAPGGYGGRPWGQPPAGPEPPKPTNPLVWLGIGCAVLVALGVGAAVAGFIWFRTSRGISASGAFSAGVEVTLDGGVLSVDAGATTGLPPGLAGEGGPTCEKAADCCRRVVEKTGAAAAALATCDSLRTNGSEAGCEQALQTYRASSRLFGVTCP